jgi:quinol-cytochrome oxidoreductase complex cytochrome b subunit/mono/diheme cytochrome c family protein
MARLRNWLDHRTGYRKLVQALLLEHIPGGAKWRYVWGSCLAFVFTVQVLTGILLMMAYSPGDTSAWGSVYFIQYEVEFGWLIRGLHHFGSQAMVILLGVHMLQVVIAGAHLPPREINWWLGLALMGLVLAMGLTGYLLPWDQKGYWATQVATNIAGGIPGIGSFLRTIIVGGPEYGNATVTRFYALHVAVIPALIVVLLIAHVAVFRRHGVTAPKDAEGEGLFWPDQAFKDMVACMIIFGILLAVVIWGGQGNAVPASAFQRAPAEEKAAATEPGWWQRLALGGREGRGANLDAPADPGEAYPARPEWYFLFLFQLLKYFPSGSIKGTVVIPNAVGVLLFLLPLLGLGRMRTLGHILGVLVVVGLLTGVGTLTCLALRDDTAEPHCRQLLTDIGLYGVPALGGFFLIYLALLGIMPRGGARRFVSLVGGLVTAVLLAGNGFLIYGALNRQLPSQVWALMRAQLRHQTDEQYEHEQGAMKGAAAFRHQLEKAEKGGHRAVELAAAGIPAQGAVLLLQRDPMTQGPRLFKNNCGVCHSWNYDPKTGLDEFHADPNQKPSFKAGDLAGFATKSWIRRLLHDPGDAKSFGRTSLEGMQNWKKKLLKARAKAIKRDPEQAKKDIAAEEADFDDISAWLAQQSLPQARRDAKLEKMGAEKFADHCATCHSIQGKGGGTAPDFTGYGSQEWLRLMVMAPNHPQRYGLRNEMPLFRDKEGLEWPIHLFHLERDKKATLQRLLDEATRDAAQRVVPPVAGLVGLGAPCGWNAAALPVASAGAALAVAADLEREGRKEIDAIRRQVARATEMMQLSDIDRELILRWMTGDGRVVFGGEPITGPPKR